MIDSDISRSLLKEVSHPTPSVRQIKQCLVLGADVNYQEHDHGYTALMIAVAGFHDRIAEYLLWQGANPLIKNHDNQLTSEVIPSDCSVYPILKDYELLFATRVNDVAAVQDIIDAGALVNCRDKEGNTPVMIAVKRNLVEMVELLFELGADLSLVKADGQGSFDLALDANMVSLLTHLKGCDFMSLQPDLTPEKNTPRFFTASGMNKR